MLYHLLYPLRDLFPVLNVFRYITFRAAAAIVTALLLSLLLGPRFIRTLRRLSVGQNIRDVGPQAHQVKAGTPTMGGLLILFAVLVPTLLWANLTNVYVWLVVLVTTAFGAIGFAVIQTDQPLPERRPATLAMVPHQVDGDAQDPGLNPAFAPETGAFLVGAQEAFLSESVRGISVPHQQEDDPIYAPLVLAHDLIEPVRRDFFGLFSRGRTQGCRQNRVHAPSLWIVS